MSAKLLSIIFIVAGLGLIFMGYQTSQEMGSQISHAFSGDLSAKTIGFYVAGGVMLLVGVKMNLKK